METILGTVKRVNLPDMVNWVDIREQNGEDDDILSNPVKSRTLSNFSEFISRVVVATSYTSNGKFTEDQVNKLPSNIRYAIIMASRIHSLGDTMEFDYTWGDGSSVRYEQDLNELMFNDYSVSPTEEELNEKPHAIPYYPWGNSTTFNLTLDSGKEVKYHLLDGAGEAFIMSYEVKTKNLEIKARGLELKVGDKWEKVENFSLFSVRDMVQIRKHMAEADPVYLGLIPIEHPTKGISTLIQVMGTPDFFYMGGL